ncbi:hypothetical protein AB205_0151000 [Aquarana catesbeiana]|uniref:Orn/DAP/Arg decarboxylase 2 N-terminal domain-containing protein n=1 Tax=Aquarana catesbeiana TaxID=8400 RepID=A0A2G9S2X8_AQUCT|nr:hypothetical protein AB205_0151000 [Aquarana catesbeiana]PIO34509.1 hypothetical protein AB205_0151000 [Aquarana catesbeiana]
MKGFSEDANYSIGLLDDTATPKDVISNYIYEHTLMGKNAFFVADLGKIVKKHIEWQNTMGHIKPFYTLKCNSSPAVLEILSALGVGFVCANKNEMTTVYDLGISMENVIYTSPCKQVSQIKHAAKLGVNIMTCDNESEMKKIARNHPNANRRICTAAGWLPWVKRRNCTSVRFLTTRGRHAGADDGTQAVATYFYKTTCADVNQPVPQSSSPSLRLLLHIATEGSTDEGEMNMVFGSTLKNCRHLLECAKECGVQVIGVTFHISSSTRDPQAYTHALSDARCVFDMAAEFGFKMNLLNIGGFSGNEFQLEEMSENRHTEDAGMGLDRWRKGKYTSTKPAFIYCLNDGVYGSFSRKLSESLNTAPVVHKVSSSVGPASLSLWFVNKNLEIFCSKPLQGFKPLNHIFAPVLDF